MVNRIDRCKKIYPSEDDIYLERVATKFRILLETIAAYPLKMGRYSQKDLVADLSDVPKMNISAIQRLCKGPADTIKRLTEKEAESFVEALTQKYKQMNLPIHLLYCDVLPEEFRDEVSEEVKAYQQTKWPNLPRHEKVTGREKEVIKLEVLLSGNSPWINITGNQGYGKTSLLIDCAKKVVYENIFEKFIWVSARKVFLIEGDLVRCPKRTYELGTIINKIIDTAGKLPRSCDSDILEKKKKAAEILQNKKWLILIDDFESFNQTGDLVEFFTGIKGDSRVLSCSCYPPPTGSHVYPIDKIPDNELKKVIYKNARRLSNVKIEDDIDKLINTVNGNIMAVQWILKQMSASKLSFNGILAELKSNSNYWKDNDIRNHLYEYSYNKTSVEAKRILTIILAAVKPVSFEQLLTISGLDEQNLQLNIEKLKNYSLVQDAWSEQHTGEDDMGEIFEIPLLAERFLLSQGKEQIRGFRLTTYLNFLIDIAKKTKIEPNNVAQELQIWQELFPYFLNHPHRVKTVALQNQLEL